jgi:histidinol dehydrogenase
MPAPFSSARHTPEVIGDYVGGSNHVLPTARSARFSSGLSVLDYVKRTSILKLGPEQLQSLGPAAITLAQAEGLDAHARSVSIRMNQRGGVGRGKMTAGHATARRRCSRRNHRPRNA